jgi:hypothetical protein
MMVSTLCTIFSAYTDILKSIHIYIHEYAHIHACKYYLSILIDVLRQIQLLELLAEGKIHIYICIYIYIYIYIYTHVYMYICKIFIYIHM